MPKVSPAVQDHLRDNNGMDMMMKMMLMAMGTETENIINNDNVKGDSK
jgi:hypothetical protein